MRLIDHLKSTGLSNRAARELMSSGKVLFCGVPTADGGRDVEPASVQIRHNARRIRVGRDPAVIWKDSHFCIVWKPPGLLSVAAPRRGSDDNLISLMARWFGAAHPVHRLDEPTSGLMMVALTKKAQYALKELLAAHDIERRYLAIVSGRFADEPMTVSNTLVEDRGDGRRGEGPGGKAATTHFRPLVAVGSRNTLIEARLESGRTHQVRIHLSDAGFPVLGDQLYSPAGIASVGPRLALHAWRLGLEHPVTGERLRFEAPLADDLEHLRRDLVAGRHSSVPRRNRQKGKTRRRR
ncbi:MAG: RluA family pseudouridine synthase [Myxococcota bacterium]|jgi:RluA family pseudouridine synthase